VSEYKPLGKKGRGRAGKFTDLADSLLPLFSDSGDRIDPRWRLLFGLEPAPPPKRGTAFIAKQVRRPPSRKA
jgi:hypothetical protein